MFGLDWDTCLDLLAKVEADFQKIKDSQEQEANDEHQQSND